MTVSGNGNGNGKPDVNPEFLRREILRTRGELAQTVEQIANRVDVKARVKESADQAKARMRAQADHAKARVRIGAEHARSRVVAGVEQARSQVRPAGGQSAGPGGAGRRLVNPVAGADREATQLAVLAAGALAAVIVLLVLRRRRG